MSIIHTEWPRRHLHLPDASAPSKPADEATAETAGQTLDLDAIRGALGTLPSAADSDFEQ